MSDGGAYSSHLEIVSDPPLRAPAVGALEALVALARADGVAAELEVPASRERHDWPAAWPLPSAWVRDPGGAGVGIHAYDGETPAEEAARAADTAHEHLVEHRPGLGRSTSWPSCPHHPETHPQQLVPGDDGDARPRWTCPRTGGELGRLG